MTGEEDSGGTKQEDNGPKEPVILSEKEIPKHQDTRKSTRQHTTDAQEKIDDALARWTKWVGVFTGLLFFAAVLQFFVLMGQLGEMKAARESGDKSFTTQLAVMQAQTRAIEGQLDQMRMQQRAFITASTFKVERSDESGSNGKPCWRFAPIIINTGVTPTKNMQFFASVTYTPQFTLPVGGMFKYADITSPIFAPSDPERVFRQFAPWTRVVLGPKQELPDVPGNDTVCLSEETGGSPLAPWRYYASGVIHYNDTFPGTEEHVTKYCFWIQARADGDAFKPVPVLCEHWNCADNECEVDEGSYKEDVQRAFKRVGSPVPDDFYVDEPPVFVHRVPDGERRTPPKQD